MKRLNFLIKYSLLYTSVFLISFIFFSKIIDVSNETLITFSIFGLVIYSITVLFFYKEINSSLKKIFTITDKLKFTEEDKENFDHFDEKINEIKTELASLFEQEEALKNDVVNVFKSLGYDL